MANLPDLPVPDHTILAEPKPTRAYKMICISTYPADLALLDDKVAVALVPDGPGGFTMEDYTTWMKRGGNKRPTRYCGGCSGHTLTWAEAKRWAKGKFNLGAEPTCTTPRLRDLGLGSGSDPCGRHSVRVHWKETYRESAVDFLAFVDEMVVPLLPREYHEIKSVIADAKAEAKPTNGPKIHALSRETTAYECTIRFVFGFDS